MTKLEYWQTANIIRQSGLSFYDRYKLMLTANRMQWESEDEQ